MKYYTIVLFACLTYIPSLLHAQELASLATDLEILTYGAQGLLDLYTVMNRTNLTPEQAHAREQTLRQLLSKNFEALTEEIRKARSNPEIQNTAVPINLNVYTKGIQDLRSSCEKYQSKKITLKELDALFRDNILLNSDTFMYHMMYFADPADFATLITIWKKLSDISQYDIQNFYFTEVIQKDSTKNLLATFLVGLIDLSDSNNELNNAFFGKDFIRELQPYNALKFDFLMSELSIIHNTEG